MFPDRAGQRHYTATAKAWVENQAQRLSISPEAVETAIKRGWLSERDKEGLRLEKYRPFPSRGHAAERDPGSEGIPALRMIEGGLSQPSTAAA